MLYGDLGLSNFRMYYIILSLQNKGLYIEKDPALERRFQTVFVDEPSVEDTISILRGLKERYEIHHGVRITDNAVISAAVLSNRYITDRQLPDKAIDLIDEAAARLRTEIDSKPSVLDDLDRDIMQLEIERQALQKEDDDASKERLTKIEASLSNLNEESKRLTLRWKSEKDAIEELKSIKESLDATRTRIEQAERDNNLENAARLRYGELPELEKRRAAAEEKLKDIQKDGALLREEVNAEEIAEVVGKWTGIPVSRLIESEIQKLAQIENRVADRKSVV